MEKNFITKKEKFYKSDVDFFGNLKKPTKLFTWILKSRINKLIIYYSGESDKSGTPEILLENASIMLSYLFHKDNKNKKPTKRFIAILESRKETK